MTWLTVDKQTSKLQAESVVHNPFFKVLKETFNELYCMAAKRGWKICVPHSRTIVGATLNAHFLKSHILQSSPYFKEEYVTLNGQCVTFKIEDGLISTKTGFDFHTKVNVLGEELFYTSDFKSFTVYCISGSLLITHMNNNISSTVISSSSTYHHHHHDNDIHSHCSSGDRILRMAIEDRNDNDWKSLLSLLLDVKINNKMQLHMQTFGIQFNRSYVIIKGFTKNAAKRIEQFRDSIINELCISSLKNNNRKSNGNSKVNNNNIQSSSSSSQTQLECIKCAFDCCLAHILYHRIFDTFLVRHFNQESVQLQIKIKHLQQHLSQTDIGIALHFQTNFSPAFDELSLLNIHKTPIAKLGCLQRTASLISQCIQRNISFNANDDKIALTTDDMLSLFTYVIIHCNLTHILANCEYLKHFHLHLQCTANLDYFCATFQGCVHYIKELEVHKKETPCNRNGKEFHKNHIQNKSQKNGKSKKKPDLTVVGEDWQW